MVSSLNSFQGASAAAAVASVWPASVRVKRLRPPDSSLAIRPSSSRSWRVGYTEPGLGLHTPPVRVSISLIISYPCIGRSVSSARMAARTLLRRPPRRPRPWPWPGACGANGAGKPTAVRVLATLLRPDAGHATVGGYAVVRQADQVRALIGLTGQYAAVDEDLTGFENLMLIGRLLELSRHEARQRTTELLERFDLADAGRRSVKTYSGGMRRRLDLAASMLSRPTVLFLDEPTTGLDPRSRGEVWQMVRERVAEGVTVLLTTQYLDEADRLAGEIAVIDHGRVIASGTPAELKAKVGGQTLDVRPTEPGDLGAVAAIVEAAGGQ